MGTLGGKEFDWKSLTSSLECDPKPDFTCRLTTTPGLTCFQATTLFFFKSLMRVSLMTGILFKCLPSLTKKQTRHKKTEVIKTLHFQAVKYAIQCIDENRTKSLVIFMVFKELVWNNYMILNQFRGSPFCSLKQIILLKQKSEYKAISNPVPTIVHNPINSSWYVHWKRKRKHKELITARTQNWNSERRKKGAYNYILRRCKEE